MPSTRTAGAHRCAAAFILSLLGCAAAPAFAAGSGGYSMEILVDGPPLEEWRGRGRLYVEALRGREYAIRLSNHTPRRAAVALAVDGVNTIDARSTSARHARKWVIPAYGSITIEGWQSDAYTARHFYFTTEEDSYAGWLGRHRQIGLISAAFFAERVPEIAGAEVEAGDDARFRAGTQSPSRDSGDARGEAAPGAAGGYAGTGSGRRVGHDVREVQLDLEPAAAAVLDVRYEYRDALVRLGILPSWPSRDADALARRERASGWSGWCPEPGP